MDFPTRPSGTSERGVWRIRLSVCDSRCEPEFDSVAGAHKSARTERQ
jgi:hypothetical protein